MTDIPREWIEACAHDAHEYKEKRCPLCGSIMITNGLAIWCTFVGGRTQPACAFSIDVRPVITAAITILRPLIEAETREMCAVIAKRAKESGPPLDPECGAYNDACDSIASALRAEGKSTTLPREDE